MRTLLFAAMAAATLVPTTAFAQDATATTADEAAAPDGTRAFGIEPYVGIMGGFHDFDSETSDAGIPPNGYRGTEVAGVAGVNVPLGPVFVGVEGNAAKGIDGSIDWEYGAAGRFGVRAGESGMIFGKVGYQWVNFDALGKDSPDYDGLLYGVGVEVGPKDIGLGGITGNSGVRLRLQADTYDMHSIRPMAGIVAHF